MVRVRKKVFPGILAFLMVLAGGILPAVGQSLKSPEAFLGYKLGAHFTPHYKVMGYFEHVAEQSELVDMHQYGTTHEGRELNYAVVTSENNIAHIDEIRTNNLKRIGLMSGEPSDRNPAIVWLSYNVHGNEAVSSEAAMRTIYELVKPRNNEERQWLENTVVVMDPMLNPDGRDRYVHWYKSISGEESDATPLAREHQEPWPGARTNHYYFDLNRDWAWQVQKETRRRIDLYQQWMPHVHVDFHEQGYNEPYYFAPAAEPFHKAITQWQRDFQFTIGKNHAKYFDRNNWLYFTRQVFDLFYPSYGDTWPLFNGAIGMTYEQGGIGAGLAVKTTDEDTLTLYDRVAHHTTTGLSTVEITAQHWQEVVDKFSQYYQKSAEQTETDYKSFVIKADNDPEKLDALLEMLDEQQVRYGKAAEADRYEGYNYRTVSSTRFEVTEDDYVVSTYQPKGVLARVLFEPRPTLTDSITYDITAWELPYVYGVEAYAVRDRIEPSKQTSVTVSSSVSVSASTSIGAGANVSSRPYAYLVRWTDHGDVKLLSALLKEGIRVRFASKPFEIAGESYDRGTLIVTRNGNTGKGAGFDKKVKALAEQFNREIDPVQTGFVTEGADFGSDDVRYLEKPNIALLTEEPTSSYNVGEIWHYLDKQIDYPVTLINTDDIDRLEWSNYHVLIMPDGYYGSDFMSENEVERLKSWIRDGGKLVALQNAISWLSHRDGFSIKRKENGEEEEKPAEKPESKLDNYYKRERNYISRANTGSIFKITMDPTHPLGYGYGEDYFSLKLDSDAYAYLEDGWNVGVAQEDAHLSGFIGYKAKDKLQNTLTFGVERMGRGLVVYFVDNPLFRGFWYNGKLLFGNALFMVGQ